MRKLKLQVQVSVDGYMAGPAGELDWTTWDMDDNLGAFINQLTDSSDTILLGRKMTDGFVGYWENVVNNQPNSPEFSFAKKMVDTPKVVFSKTLDRSTWNNTTLANGDIANEVTQLKSQPGKDIIAYGGAQFVASLVQSNLIDDYYLFVNPVALGKGLPLFADRTKLKLIDSTAYSCGIVIHHYQPVGG